MTDLLLKNNDLEVVGGDFVTGESDAQHVHHLLVSHKGEYKQYPLTGLGRAKFQNGILDGETRRDAQVQLEADGYRLTGFSVDAIGNLAVQFSG